MTDPEDPTSAESQSSTAAGAGPDGAGDAGPLPVDRDANSPDEPSLGAEVEPSPATAVEPSPTTEVEAAPVTDVEPVPPPVKAATDVAPAERVTTGAAGASGGASQRPDFEEDTDDAGDTAAGDLEPIPRWVSLVSTVGVGLVVVIAAWTVAAVIQGLYYPGRESQDITNDLLHRLGTAFVPTHWVTALVTLIFAVVLLSLPVLFEEDVTYGQERAASTALVVVVILAVIICLGAILAVRASLHAITAQGQAVPSFYRIDRTAYLLATLGTGILAGYAALVARGMRYGTD